MKTTQTYYYPRKEGEGILEYTKRTKANTSYLNEIKETQDDVYNYHKEYAPKVTHWVTVALTKSDLSDYIEDTIQEVWLRVKTYESTYDPSKPFEGWLNVVTQHVIADLLAEVKNQHSMFQSLDELVELGFDVIDEEAMSPEEILDRKQQIVEFMKVLSPQEGMVATLLMDGASNEEIQVELEMTYGQVNMTSHRIREKAESFFKK